MPVTLREFTTWIEGQIPLTYQESYDNSGLQAGDPDSLIGSVLLSLDINEDVVREAKETGATLIVSHHPVIFAPLKSLGYASVSERCIALAIKSNIAIYSAHTNLDAMAWGVSHIMAVKAGLKNIRVLRPSSERLLKIVTFVPDTHARKVREALFSAGAGSIGKYDSCSFNVTGEGTFRPGEGTAPFAGTPGLMHPEKETRIETVCPVHLLGSVIRALTASHPYEEPAYDIIPLANVYHGAGAGALGTLPAPVSGTMLLSTLKEIFGTPVIRYSGDISRMVETVAVCGGSGAHLAADATRAGADAFITGDVKYHSFTGTTGDMIIADIGHYESEKFSLQLLYDLIVKKFPKFAVRFSGIKTNPINYF